MSAADTISWPAVTLKRRRKATMPVLAGKHHGHGIHLDHVSPGRHRHRRCRLARDIGSRSTLRAGLPVWGRKGPDETSSTVIPSRRIPTHRRHPFTVMVGEGPPSTTLILKGNPWIPAFAGMTRWCRRRVEFNATLYKFLEETVWLFFAHDNRVENRLLTSGRHACNSRPHSPAIHSSGRKLHPIGEAKKGDDRYAFRRPL
jgi:hypothetical protein